MTENRNPTDLELENAIASSYSNESPTWDHQPSDNHLAELRHQLLSKTDISTDADSLNSAKTTPTIDLLQLKSTRIWFMRLTSLAAVIFVMLVGSQLFVETASGSLASALESTRRSLWIHGQTTATIGKETFKSQTWCSPSQRIAAFHSATMIHFVNYQEGIQSRYDETTKSIYQWRADRSQEEMGRTFITALLTHGDLGSAFPDHHVSSVTRTTRLVGGYERQCLTFDVKAKNVRGVSWTTQVDIDPANGRITDWSETHTNGFRILTKFDYPDAGPLSIYELGAPSAAKTVDLSSATNFFAFPNRDTSPIPKPDSPNGR